MLARQMELEEIRGGLQPSELKQQLIHAYNDFKNVGPFSPLQYLVNWSNLL